MTDARELVRAGRFVQVNNPTAKALAEGDLAPAHTKILARAARHVEDLYPDAEAPLVDAAKQSKPDEFRSLASRWRSIADDLAGRGPKERNFDRRNLSLAEVLDGMGRVEGWLDAETIRRLALVLDGLEPPDPPDGEMPPRPLLVRRADGFAKLVGGERAPRVTVFGVVDVETLAGRTPTDLTSMRCDLVGAGTVDVASMLRITCDCSLSRVLMRGSSVVLDLGRATPVVSDAQRRALAVRDGGCTEEGCGAPPEWCDAHHVVHWAQGGPTDLANLELKCRRHHVAAHQKRGPPMDLAA